MAVTAAGGKVDMSSRSLTLNAEQQEIARLLDFVASQTPGDPYTGKRRNLRYRLPVQFEATLDPAGAADVFPVTLHNVCETGIAFLSRTEIPPRKNIYLRQFSAGWTSDWIGAHVTHCTKSLRGFIIGAELHNPIQQSDWISALDTSADTPQDEADPYVPPDTLRGRLMIWLGRTRHSN